MRPIDADKLKEDLFIKFGNQLPNGLLDEVDNATEVETDIEVVAKDAYEQGYTDGWKERFGEPDERPHGECENCDFRKFTGKFVDGVVEVMKKNDIASLEQLSEILKGGAECD